MNLQREQYRLKIRFIWTNYLGKMLVKKYFYGFLAKRRLKRNVKKYEIKYKAPIFFEIIHNKTNVEWDFLTTNLDLLLETEKELNEGVQKELDRKMKRIKVDRLKNAINKLKNTENISKESIAESIKKNISKESIAESIKKNISEKLGYFIDFEYFFDDTKIDPHNEKVYTALTNNEKKD